MKSPLACLALFSTVAFAQSLPPPSRTVYRCEEGGRVHYTDSPCLGAKKLEVEPTRGLNQTSGRERIGADVRHEQHREQVANSLQPLTGMNAKQLDQAGRRMRLSAEAQRQCRGLDRLLPAAETAERSAKASNELATAQRRLLELRTAYRQLRCA